MYRRCLSCRGYLTSIEIRGALGNLNCLGRHLTLKTVRLQGFDLGTSYFRGRNPAAWAKWLKREFIVIQSELLTPSVHDIKGCCYTTWATDTTRTWYKRLLLYSLSYWHRPYMMQDVTIVHLGAATRLPSADTNCIHTIVTIFAERIMQNSWVILKFAADGISADPV